MIALFCISILPVLVLIIYIYNKDKNKEPIKLLRKIFIGGIFSFVPILICEGIFSSFFDIYNYKNLFMLFLTTFLGIGLIEEVFKWVVVYIFTFKNKDFDEVYDAIVYAVCSSLGFACIENILYIITSDITTGIYRAVTAVPVHACNGIVMGYYLGLAKKRSVNNDEKSNKYLILSLLMPILAHTIYDFLLLSHNKTLVFIWFVMYVAFFSMCMKTVKRVAEREERIDNNYNSGDYNSNYDNKNI